MINDTIFDELIDAKIDLIKKQELFDEALKDYNEVGKEAIDNADYIIRKRRYKSEEQYEFYWSISVREDYKLSTEKDLKESQIKFDNLMRKSDED